MTHDKAKEISERYARMWNEQARILMGASVRYFGTGTFSRASRWSRLKNWLKDLLRR